MKEKENMLLCLYVSCFLIKLVNFFKKERKTKQIGPGPLDPKLWSFRAFMQTFLPLPTNKMLYHDLKKVILKNDNVSLNVAWYIQLGKHLPQQN